MTELGDLLGNIADKLAQDNLNIGDVHLLNLDQNNGITPKAGDNTRNKFFIILGFDTDGNVYWWFGNKLKYQLQLANVGYRLSVACNRRTSPIFRTQLVYQLLKDYLAKRSKFNKSTYRGAIYDTEMMELIINTVKESPTVNKKQLKEFGII